MIIHKKLIKSHKPHVNSIEYKTTILLQGNIGLKVLEKGWIEVKQYNAMKHYLKRFLKKKRGCIWYRFFPEFFVTKKALGNARMGKGKGAVDRLMLYVKKGQILFEIVYKKKLKDKFVKNLLKQCQFKMPLNTKIFSYKK